VCCIVLHKPSFFNGLNGSHPYEPLRAVMPCKSFEAQMLTFQLG
jgi:hypothetical protein